MKDQPIKDFTSYHANESVYSSCWFKSCVEICARPKCHMSSL